MRNILKIICGFLIILFLRFFLSFIVNEYIIFNYNRGVYNEFLVKTLYLLNINQSYIAYYNNGNILYQLNNYDEAIKYYEKSLMKNPPKSKVCDIRINLSLALIKNINSDDPKLIYNQLELAKENLYKDNCADSNGDKGESADAEEFEDKINKLQDEYNSNSTGEDQIEIDDSNIEDELRNIQSTARSSREEDLSAYENLSKYSYYSGKRW